MNEEATAGGWAAAPKKKKKILTPNGDEYFNERQGKYEL